MINYYDYCIVENEYLYGPSKRLLIFLQGCSLHCKGCVNSNLWEFKTGKDIEPEEIVSICTDNYLDGITLHGGEPLDQASELILLMQLLKQNDMTIVLFTGYQKKELSFTQKWVWNYSDIVVSGRYIESKRNIYSQFKGSTNQRIYTHKGKYKNYQIKDGKTVAILTLNSNASLNLKGFYPDEMKEYIDGITKKEEKK